jgi:LysR family hydrogen peroxide-inducible transcriptional activator
MNIRDLKYLVALAEYQHFGKAAEKCFVSQPALSMQIQKLEEILDIKLLERTNKSFIFTENGLAITQRAREILSQVDEVHELAKSAKDPYRGELKIGIIPTLAPYLLPLIIPTLVKKFPNLSFYLLEEQTALLSEKLKTGKLHACFFALPISEKGFKTSHLFDEEFLLAIPRKHALAKLKAITQHDLMDYSLLLLEEGHCMRDQALVLCQKLKANETQSFRATSLETLRHMVAAGVSMTLMPKLACTANKNINYVPFHAPKPVRSICLAWRESTVKTQLLEEIADQIKILMEKSKKVKTHK